MGYYAKTRVLGEWKDGPSRDSCLRKGGSGGVSERVGRRICVSVIPKDSTQVLNKRTVSRVIGSLGFLGFFLSFYVKENFIEWSFERSTSVRSVEGSYSSVPSRHSCLVSDFYSESID